MKFLSKNWFRACTAAVGASMLIGSGATVWAANDIKSMENQSSELQKELSGINQDLLTLGSQIANVENQIEETTNEIEQIQEQLGIARRSEEQQYEEMKLRIKYMYENGDTTMFEMFMQVDSMADFLNKVDFVKNISEYDREKLEELHDLQVAIADQETKLSEDKESQEKLEKELSAQKTVLNKKAADTSTDISMLNTKIAKMREEERKAAEEAARKAAEEKAAKEAAEKAAKEAGKNTDKNAGVSNPASGNTSSASYTMPSGNGVLTKRKGVNYYNGHRETYYSQRVLPGHGLNIPGRHVAGDGTIRDGDGYICVASEDYPKGTVVETSLGTAKVYDCGCAKGTIDIYTDW